MNQPLSPTERKVYQYLYDFLSEHSYQPSVREIGRGLRIKSTKTVTELLKALADKGYIERERSRSRGVRLLGFPSSRLTTHVPCVEAGFEFDPTLDAGNRENFIAMDRRFVPGENCFFVRISGDGLATLGILRGDYVMIQPSASFRQGDMIASRDADQICVQPWTPATDSQPSRARRPVHITPLDSNADILGRVAAVFRPMGDSMEPAGTAVAPLPS